MRERCYSMLGNFFERSGLYYFSSAGNLWWEKNRQKRWNAKAGERGSSSSFFSFLIIISGSEDLSDWERERQRKNEPVVMWERLRSQRFRRGRQVNRMGSEKERTKKEKGNKEATELNAWMCVPMCSLYFLYVCGRCFPCECNVSLIFVISKPITIFAISIFKAVWVFRKEGWLLQLSDSGSSS